MWNLRIAKARFRMKFTSCLESAYVEDEQQLLYLFIFKYLLYTHSIKATRDFPMKYMKHFV